MSFFGGLEGEFGQAAFDVFNEHFVDTAGNAGGNAADAAAVAPYEVAYVSGGGFETALSPDQWPGDVTENPREYLDYLLDKAENDQRMIEQWYAIVLAEYKDKVDDGSVDYVKGAMRDLIKLQNDIESARDGIFSPSQGRVSNLYSRLMSIREMDGASVA